MPSESIVPPWAAIPEVSMPELAIPELAIPEAATPKVSMPEVLVPEAPLDNTPIRGRFSHARRKSEPDRHPARLDGRLAIWNLVPETLAAKLLIALLVLGALGWAYAWATASPVGSSPDENFHLASIWCPHGLGFRCPTRLDPGTDRIEVEVPIRITQAAHCYRFDLRISAGCTETIPAGSEWTHTLNRGEYPDHYFNLMHYVVQASYAGDLFPAVVSVRMLNAIIAIILFGGVAYFLPPSGRRLFGLSFLPVSFPMLWSLVVSVNPSGWSIIGLCVAFFAMYAANRGQTRFRILAPVILALIGGWMAIASRTDAAAFLAAVAIVIVVMDWQEFRARPLLFACPAILLAMSIYPFASAVFGGYLAWLITSGAEAQPVLAITRQLVASEEGLPPLPLLVSNIMELPQYLLGFAIGDLNWRDTPVPPLAWAPVLAATTGLVFFGLRRTNLRKTLCFLGLLAVYAGVPLLFFQLTGNLVGHFIQERYVAPLVPILMAVALWRPERGGAPRLAMPQILPLYLGLVIAQAAILWVQIRRFTTGLYTPRFFLSPTLNTDVEWWQGALSPFTTWFIGALGFALVALLLFCLGTRATSRNR